jgi:hypothetical protein
MKICIQTNYLGIHLLACCNLNMSYRNNIVPIFIFKTVCYVVITIIF